jgi:predicted DNA-binding transcriptional regulator AlpA
VLLRELLVNGCMRFLATDGGSSPSARLHASRTDAPERRAVQVVADSEALLEPLLTAAEVARILGVRPKRVYELGIPAVRLSEKCMRWRPSQVQAWLDSRSDGGQR